MPAEIKLNDGTIAPTPAPAIPVGLQAIVRASRGPRSEPSLPPRRMAKKTARKRSGLLYLVVAAGLVLAASGFVLNRTWPKFLAFAPSPAPVVASKPDPAALNQKSGYIIIPRANTNLCDRWVFDNASGQMKKAETVPCGGVGKKPEINLSDQVNSFHSSWRGSGGAPGGPNAPRGPGPEAGPPPR
jgi:hypothetical protein